MWCAWLFSLLRGLLALAAFYLVVAVADYVEHLP